MKKTIWLLACILFATVSFAQADTNYLSNIKAELIKTWPNNRTINLVFHGHSVPSGYFQTPAVHTLEAYPHQTLSLLKSRYPNAVVNVITTSIGGENSEQGEKRFKKDVLIHKPDVLFIDYALNDRSIGLDRARIATEKMIKAALKQKIKLILLTPSPDLSVDLTKEGNVLEQFAQQLRSLAVKYSIGLVDSYAQFKAVALQKIPLKNYMAQSNHPNAAGHQLIAKAIMEYFR